MSYTAPCIIPPLEQGAMFRVAFDAKARFATDEDGLYVPPHSALLRVTNLAQQLLENARQASGEKKPPGKSRRDSAASPGGRKSVIQGFRGLFGREGSSRGMAKRRPSDDGSARDDDEPAEGSRPDAVKV